MLCDYWTLVVPKKTPAESMAERWLFVLPLGNNFYARLDCIPFHRWYLFLACCLIQLCAGSVYSFTMLADTLDMYFYGSVLKQASRVQLLAYICLGVSAAFTGPFLERRGPRVGMFVGSTLVACGHLLSQLAVTYKAPVLLTIGYGVCIGLGFGLLLIVSISTVQKWFPDVRGLASGCCILFFGIGNGLFITVTSKLLQQPVGTITVTIQGEGILHIFWISGVFTTVVLLLCTLVLRTPPSTFLVNGKDMHGVPESRAPNPDIVQDEYLNVGMTLVNYTVVQHEIEGSDGYYFQQVKALSLLQCIASTDFLCLYVAFAANIMPILVFLPQIRQLAIGILRLRTQEDIYEFFYYTYVGNLGGRFLSPVLSDLLIRVCYANPAFARKVVFVTLLVLQCIVLVLIPSYIQDPIHFKYLASILTSAAGGGLALMPSFITDMFGVYNGGTMYGVIWTSWSLGAVVSGYSLSMYAFTLDGICRQMHWMLILTGVACGLMIFVRTNSMDRFFYGYQFSAFGKVLVQIPFRLPARETLDESVVSDVTMLTPTMNHPDGFILWNAETDGRKYGIR